MRRNRAGRVAIGALVVAVAAAACSSSGSHPSASGQASSSSTTAAPSSTSTTLPSSVTSADRKVTLAAVSAPAPFVSGTSLMVQIRRTRPGSTPGAAMPVVLQINGKAQSGVAMDGYPSPTAERVVVSGLVDGPNTVSATVAGSTATLHVVDHSIQGPVFSGPRQTPFACTTAGAGLGPSSPPDCAAPTKVIWHYLSTDGTVQPLPDPGQAAGGCGHGDGGRPLGAGDRA